MARSQHIRHLRHRRLAGLSRGASARPRLRHLDGWLDGIATTLSATAAANAVTANATTNQFALATHGLETGEIVQLAGTAVPTGSAVSTDYFCIVVDSGNVQIARSFDDAIAGNAVDISDTGTAVTMTRQADTAALVALLRGGKSTEQLDDATDIDAI